MDYKKEDMTPLWAKKAFQNRPDYPASSCTLRKGKYYVSVALLHKSVVGIHCMNPA